MQSLVVFFKKTITFKKINPGFKPLFRTSEHHNSGVPFYNLLAISTRSSHFKAW